MWITRIDIEGNPGRYATITRRQNSDRIEVTILTPQWPDGKGHHIAADAGDEELWAHATNLQIILEEALGTNSDIRSYFTELQRFQD